MIISKNKRRNDKRKAARPPRPRPIRRAIGAVNLKVKLPLSGLKWPSHSIVTKRAKWEAMIANALKDTNGKLPKPRAHNLLVELVDAAIQDVRARLRPHTVVETPSNLAMNIFRWCLRTAWTQSLMLHGKKALVNFWMVMMEARAKVRMDPKLAEEMYKKQGFQVCPPALKIDEFQALVSENDWSDWYIYQPDTDGDIDGCQGGNVADVTESNQDAEMQEVAANLDNMEIWKTGNGTQTTAPNKKETIAEATAPKEMSHVDYRREPPSSILSCQHRNMQQQIKFEEYFTHQECTTLQDRT